MVQEVATMLRTRLDELGIGLTSKPTLERLPENQMVGGSLHHGTSFTICQLLFTRHMTATSVAEIFTVHEDGMPLFVVGPRITERSAEMFRQLGINFLDQAGNAWIRFGSVLIDIRGRRGEKSPQMTDARGPQGTVNLFSPKRAQIIFALLAWPDLVQKQVRVIARAAGASLGQVQDTLNLLEELHYLDAEGGKRRRLRRTDELVDLWAHAYPSGLGAGLGLYALHGNVDNWAGPEEVPLYISGESALRQHIRPTTLTLYVGEHPKKLIVANRWKASTTPNVFLRQKFWEEPENGEYRQTDQRQSAPPLLVYADLLNSNEPRQREVAKQMRLDFAELQ